MSAALGLDPLLAALREAGLPVGVAEMARLRQVFSLGPQLGPEEDRRLRSILRAVLVKSAEDRARFEPVFDAWVGRAGQEVSLREAPPIEPIPATETPRRRRHVWRMLAAAFLPLLVLILGDEVREQPKPPPRIESQKPPGPTPPVSPAKVLTPADIRKKSFVTWVPTLTVTPAEPVWEGWPALGLGSLALVTAGGLWLGLRRLGVQRESLPEPAKKGPPRVFLTPPQLAGPQLLEPREQEALVWGIGHFVADEPTRRLDLETTVRETARAGGVPHLLFHQARHPREVWLWIDEAADDPALPRLADEIVESLRIHNLPVERALFRGVPDWLVTAGGQAFAPNEVDERRDAALVAILTDGRVLARQYAADDRKVKLDALLRGLSHWPRLAFVDFAAERGELATVLTKHALSRITPPELAAFLGSDETAKRKASVAVSGDDVWAAACALAPTSVDELRAFQLRKRLRLATSAWALRRLRAEAPGPPGRLQWRPQDRARRINWLREAEAHPEGGIARESLLGQALEFWEEVYDQELNARQAGDREGAWLDTPAYQHLAMERALLGLWRDAPKAVQDLYRLHGGALREVIERHLQALAPLDWGGPDLVHLPWAWAERSGAERIMLQEMKLGGGMPAATLRRPGRLWLGLGICVGLAVGALAASALSGQRRPEGPPTVIHGPGKPADAFQSIRRRGEDAAFNAFLDFMSKRAGETKPVETLENWEITVGTRKSLVNEIAPTGGRVNVQWKQQSRPCVSKLEAIFESWSCGTIENPSRFSESAGMRIIALSTSLGSPEAEAFAVDLLDSGSADQVFLSPSLRVDPQSPFSIAKFEEGVESLTFTESNWSQLRQALRFDGIRPVRQVWPELVVEVGDPSAQIRGLSDCWPGELLVDQGMTFVRICPGTFTMGSTADDPQAYKDEKPAHEVTLSEFWIGRTEVTNAQYGRPDLQADLPVTDVTWHEAKDFCKRHGWRLPTEAEWEYAARAGTRTPWSFSGDETRLEEFAWFAGNSGGEPQPVGTRKANPWGLYDMHGNVWEWAADWYGPYTPGPQSEPQGPVTGEFRTVRGGSFVFAPRFLRSAFRDGFRPSIRVRGFGFRCARSPSRQP